MSWDLVGFVAVVALLVADLAALWWSMRGPAEGRPAEFAEMDVWDPGGDERG